MRKAQTLTAAMLTLALTACGTAGGFAPNPAASTSGSTASTVSSTSSAQNSPTYAQDGQTFTNPNASTSSSNSSTSQPQAPSKEPAVLNPRELVAGTEVSPTDIEHAGGEDAFFWVEPIPDNVFARMQGKSFGEDCTIPRDDLRYLKVLHVNAEGVVMVGEMVVHRNVADEVLDIFHKLYDAKWPIKKMHLIDDYDGSDDASCADGNSSSFNFRKAVNANVLSNHAYGLAIDINTFENPYYIPERDYVYPPEAASYLNRNMYEPYMIHRDDLCYQLFTEHGWVWGGDWPTPVDYQHFEKPSALYN